jgi:hypothetical protein
MAANQNVATGVTWKPMSDLMASMAHGNGIATTAAYDLDYRLASLMVQDGATLVSSLAYAYVDDPSPGFSHGNGRVFQFRYKKKPVFRMDYQPIPGSKGKSRLHFHCAPFIDYHIPIDPRSFFD